MVSTTTCPIRAPNLPLTSHPAICPKIRNNCSYEKVLSQNWLIMERDPMKNVKAKLFLTKVWKLYHEKRVGKIAHQKKVKVFSIRKSESVFVRKVKVFSSDWESPDLRLHHQFAKEKTVIGFSSKQKRIHFKYNSKHVLIYVQSIFGWWLV